MLLALVLIFLLLALLGGVYVTNLFFVVLAVIVAFVLLSMAGGRRYW